MHWTTCTEYSTGSEIHLNLKHVITAKAQVIRELSEGTEIIGTTLHLRDGSTLLTVESPDHFFET